MKKEGSKLWKMLSVENEDFDSRKRKRSD